MKCVSERKDSRRNVGEGKEQQLLRRFKGLKRHEQSRPNVQAFNALLLPRTVHSQILPTIISTVGLHPPSIRTPLCVHTHPKRQRRKDLLPLSSILLRCPIASFNWTARSTTCVFALAAPNLVPYHWIHPSHSGIMTMETASSHGASKANVHPLQGESGNTSSNIPLKKNW